MARFRVAEGLDSSCCRPYEPWQSSRDGEPCIRLSVRRASHLPGVAIRGHWQRVRGLARHRIKNAEGAARMGNVRQCSRSRDVSSQRAGGVSVQRGRAESG